jgi:hypothetical protein
MADSRKLTDSSSLERSEVFEEKVVTEADKLFERRTL